MVCNNTCKCMPSDLKSDKDIRMSDLRSDVSDIRSGEIECLWTSDFGKKVEK